MQIVKIFGVNVISCKKAILCTSVWTLREREVCKRTDQNQADEPIERETGLIDWRPGPEFPAMAMNFLKDSDP
jgi:hypothetical protein